MLLWAESFDYFGADKAKMLDGLWAQLDSNWDLSTSQARTGTRSLKMSANNSGAATGQARRVFGGPKATVGIGFASYLTALPIANDTYGISFRDAANAEQFTLYIQSTGIIEAKRGSTSLGATAVPAVTANAWHHIEVKAIASDTVGAVEIRVNEVTRLNLTGIDTLSTANVEFSQVMFGDLSSSASNADWYLDDMFAWDDTTDGDNDINDFVGDKKVFTVLPNGDTSVADFGKSSGSVGYSLIDDAIPDDTGYIYTADDGDVSEFNLTNLPGDVAEVVAVIPLPRVFKTDAGSVSFSADLVSGTDATAADPIPATTQPTYWPFVFTKDPATGVPFVPSGFDAAKIRLTRG